MSLRIGFLIAVFASTFVCAAEAQPQLTPAQRNAIRGVTPLQHPPSLPAQQAPSNQPSPNSSPTRDANGAIHTMTLTMTGTGSLTAAGVTPAPATFSPMTVHVATLTMTGTGSLTAAGVTPAPATFSPMTVHVTTLTMTGTGSLGSTR